VPSDSQVPIASATPPEKGTEWLLLIYKIPPEPTRLRAGAWRRLKSLGAVYLQNSVAAFPRTPASERALRKLRHDIIEMSGTAVLTQTTVLAGEETILSLFQAARTDEFDEIVDRCEGFLEEIQKEYDKSHFSYAELEENEVDYTKLANWFAKVCERDHFGADGRSAAQAALERCERSLEDYAARVYAEEPEGH